MQISFKLPDEEVVKLEVIRAKLRTDSIHIACKVLVLMAIASVCNGSDETKFLSIEADLHQVISELQKSSDRTESLAAFVGCLAELLLINLGGISPEAAGAAVKELFEASFSEEED